MNKKRTTTCAIFLVCLFLISSIVNAAPQNSVNVEKIRNRLETYVTITDAETGEQISYPIDSNVAQIYYNPVNSETTVVYENIGKPIQTRDQSQSNSNTFYGWKGNVRITWYQDDTWAKLTSAGGDWTRVSGSYTMSEKTIDYGQYLGTNSRNGSASFINSYNIGLNWPSGKYGDGHFLGANINGKVNGQYVNITCNYTLF